MVGVVFNGLDGKEMPLGEIVSGDFQDGDEIQVYVKNGNYQVYTYWKDSGWLNSAFEEAKATLALGTAFRLKTPNSPDEDTLKGAGMTGEDK